MFTLLHSAHFSLSKVMLALVFGACNFNATAFANVMLLGCDEITLAFQEMQLLLERLQSSCPMVANTNRHLKLDSEWNLIATQLKLTVISFIPMKLVLPAFIVYLNIDPIYNYYILYNWETNLLDKLARYCCVQLAFIVGTHTFGATMVILSLWLEMQSKFLERLYQISDSSINDEFFARYNEFQIVSKIVQRPASQWVQILMGGLSGMFAIFMVVSVRYVGELPLQVFWFIPTGAAIIGLVLIIVFPYLAGCQERSVELLRKRKFYVSAGAGKRFERMKLRSARPVAMHCGEMFPIKRRTKSELLAAILARIMEGIIF